MQRGLQNDVWVYVLSGEIGALVGEQVLEAGTGEWALKPRNVQHSMWDAGRDTARIIEVLTPGGTEGWLEEIAALGDDDSAGFESACERYGIESFRDSPCISELRKRSNIDLFPRAGESDPPHG